MNAKPFLALVVFLGGLYAQVEYWNPEVFGTISLIEIFSLLVNVPGVIYSLSNYMEAARDLSAVRREGVPDERDLITALGNRRVERLILLIQSGLLLITLLALFVPNPLVSQVRRLQSMSGYVVFIGVSLFCTWTARKNKQDRKRLRSLSRRYVPILQCTSADPECYFRQVKAELLAEQGKEQSETQHDRTE